jgi:hypothetical protein
MICQCARRRLPIITAICTGLCDLLAWAASSFAIPQLRFVEIVLGQILAAAEIQNRHGN